MSNISAQDSNSLQLEIQKPIQQQKRLKSAFQWGIMQASNQNRGHIYLQFNVKYLDKLLYNDQKQIPVQVRSQLHNDCIFFAKFQMCDIFIKGNVQFFFKHYKGLTMKVFFKEKNNNEVPFTNGYLKSWYKDPSSSWKSKGFQMDRAVQEQCQVGTIKLNGRGVTTRNKKQKQRIFKNEFQVLIPIAQLKQYLKKQHLLFQLQFYELEPDKKQKFKGIRNTGNICYSNSLVQILYFIRPLRKLIIQGKNQKKSQMFIHLQQLFCQLASKQIQGPIDPTQFMRCFSHYDQFNPQQQDIQQFMMIFFAMIQQDNETTKCFWQGLGQNILQSKNSKLRYQSKQKDIFNQLDIHMDDHRQNTFKTIYQSLEYLMKQQNVQQYIDTQQHGKIQVKKRRIFHELPDVLFLNLKRYSYDNKKGSLTKIFAQMTYEQKINLSFMLGTPTEQSQTENQYSLFAVTVHKGRSPFHGHYYSFINTSQKMDDPYWYLFNDSQVKPADIKDILEKYNGKKQKRISLNKQFGRWEQKEVESDQTAYLLVYLKDTIFDQYQATKCKIPQNIITKLKKKYKALQEEKTIQIRVAVVNQTTQYDFSPFNNDQEFVEVPLNKELPIKPQIEQIQSLYLGIIVGTIWKVNIQKKKVIYCGKRFCPNPQSAQIHCSYHQGHNLPDYFILVDCQLSNKNSINLQTQTNLALLHIKDQKDRDFGRFQVINRSHLDQTIKNIQIINNKKSRLQDNQDCDFIDGWNDYCELYLYEQQTRNGNENISEKMQMQSQQHNFMNNQKSSKKAQQKQLQNQDINYEQYGMSNQEKQSQKNQSKGKSSIKSKTKSKTKKNGKNSKGKSKMDVQNSKQLSQQQQ